MIVAIVSTLFYWLFFAMGTPEKFTEVTMDYVTKNILDYIGETQRDFVSERQKKARFQALPGSTITWTETEQGLLLMLKTSIKTNLEHLDVPVTLTEPLFIETLEELLRIETNYLRFLPSFQEEIKKQTSTLIRHKLKHPYMFSREPKGSK